MMKTREEHKNRRKSITICKKVDNNKKNLYELWTKLEDTASRKK